MCRRSCRGPINPRFQSVAANKASVPSVTETASYPIGVFDSGIGGLTVVKALRDLLPNETILYLGDTARVPYGSKSASTVERYSLEMAEILATEHAKIIVVACNTASSLALTKLQENFALPVIGVIRPGAEAAVNASRNRHIGVIGTRATIKSRAYEKAMRELNPHVHVTSRACPLLVPLIEEGWLEDELTDRAITRYIEPLVREGIDTLVLGCTHYPLLAPAMERILGSAIKLVDSARNCARAVQQLLDRKRLRAPSKNRGGLHVALTDAPDNFLSVAKKALQLDIGEVQLREVLHGVAKL
jgi:glutamate racemase